MISMIIITVGTNLHVYTIQGQTGSTCSVVAGAREVAKVKILFHIIYLTS